MGFTLNIMHEGQLLSQQVPANKSLLHTLSQTRHSPVQVGCKGGGCGVCKVRVVAGDYDSKPMSKAHISDTDKAAGVVLACRIFPKSNLTVLPIGNTKNESNC